jgi:hypothetical protein
MNPMNVLYSLQALHREHGDQVMRTNTVLISLFLAGMLLPALPETALPQERTTIQDLRGRWLFEIGDDESWADPKFNDKKWDGITVPSPWEDQGYPGYDGYGWYRKHFTTRPEWREKVLYINLGTIDDVDEVYVNGHFIAFSGLFPPHYVTNYASTREYPLPQWCLNYNGDNVVAVRVYDNEQAGGITSGRVGIEEERDPLRPTQSLAGDWKIRTGDDPSCKESGYDDAGWRSIPVPAFWETQGMKDYDGFAWYRFHFHPSPALEGKKLILLVGKIDDIDETYLNGERIGRTGVMYSNPNRISVNNEYLELRAYTIPPGTLKFGEDNIIAVRVFDKMLHGGIYDGPVGIMTRDEFLPWQAHHKTRKTPWDFFREWLW